MSSLRFSRAFNEASSDVSTKIPTQSNSQEAGVAGEKPLSEIHGACEPRPATTRANKSPAKQREVTYDKMGPFSGLRVKRGYEVWLHVYDLDVMAARMNELFLRSMSLGAYHCGVEVLGREWFASFGRTDRSGVVWHDPKQHSIHIYKESVAMGTSPLSQDEIMVALCDAMDNWPENSYHPISRNCITFAEELLAALKVPNAFPAWVRGAASAANSKILFPVADYGWEWIKWWHSPAPRPLDIDPSARSTQTSDELFATRASSPPVQAPLGEPIDEEPSITEPKAPVVSKVPFPIMTNVKPAAATLPDAADPFIFSI